MRTAFIRRTGAVLLALLLAIGAPVLLYAQTALNSTTLSAAVTLTTTQITVASASTIAVNDVLVVDKEAMIVTAISGTTLQVKRGMIGTDSAPHPSAALVYTGTPDKFGSGSRPPSGACTRSAELFLPRVVLPGGDVYDCTVGTGVWSLANGEGVRTVKTAWFNLDNGAGTTIDDVLINFARPVRITACRAVEVDATAGTVAAGNWKVGITVGGAEIVAATAYVNAATVGTATAGTIVSGAVAANVAVFVRHTGVAATAAGQAYVECDYVIR